MDNFDKKKYNQQYYKKHKQDWYESVICEICKGRYSRSSKNINNGKI